MKSWPHAPSKAVTAPGTYIVTAGTYHKERLFHGAERTQLLHDIFLACVAEEGWTPMAWAVFENHYHLVAITPDSDVAVKRLTSKIHTLSARALNKLDNTPGRSVWYRCWPTRLTYEKSVMARLAYVHNNAVKHGLVARAEDYPWCSARWFLNEGDRPFVQSVLSFKTDTVNVPDDF